MVARIHIVGRMNSAKTTLVAELVSHLCELGYRIGTIKHTHHHHELDAPGKDSFRHREAGASVVGILAPTMSAVFEPSASDQSTNERYDKMLAMFAECDVVLVEGDTNTDEPKIEVWRAAAHTEPLAARDASILALVTDDPVDVPVLVKRRSDVAGLATWMLECCGCRRVRRGHRTCHVSPRVLSDNGAYV